MLTCTGTGSSCAVAFRSDLARVGLLLAAAPLGLQVLLDLQQLSRLLQCAVVDQHLADRAFEVGAAAVQRLADEDLGAPYGRGHGDFAFARPVAVAADVRPAIGA